jgi:hypothetical protein
LRRWSATHSQCRPKPCCVLQIRADRLLQHAWISFKWVDRLSTMPKRMAPYACCAKPSNAARKSLSL